MPHLQNCSKFQYKNGKKRPNRYPIIQNHDRTLKIFILCNVLFIITLTNKLKKLAFKCKMLTITMTSYLLLIKIIKTGARMFMFCLSFNHNVFMYFVKDCYYF